MHAVLSRRDLLSKCFAAGLLVAIPPLSQSTMLALWEEAEKRRLKPTPPNDLGPFYKPQAPRVNRLSRPGDPGLPLSVSGTVFDVNGEALPNALLEIWQADPFPWQTQAFPMPRREESVESILMHLGTPVFSHFFPEAFGRRQRVGDTWLIIRYQTRSSPQ